MAKVKNKQRTQLIWFFGIIVAVFVIFFASYLYFQSLDRFSFGGLKWHIDKDSPEPYQTQIPTFYNNSLNYNVFMRTDPRENNITFNTSDLEFYKNAIISVSPDVGACPGANLPVFKISKFLSLFGGIRSVGAVSDRDVAKEMNVSFADCSSANGFTVVLLNKSEETGIVKEKDCYIINVDKCENLIAATEKFELGILLEKQKNS